MPESDSPSTGRTPVPTPARNPWGAPMSLCCSRCGRWTPTHSAHRLTPLWHPASRRSARHCGLPPRRYRRPAGGPFCWYPTATTTAPRPTRAAPPKDWRPPSPGSPSTLWVCTSMMLRSSNFDVSPRPPGVSTSTPRSSRTARWNKTWWTGWRPAISATRCPTGRLGPRSPGRLNRRRIPR